jgi:hypothetical protein
MFEDALNALNANLERELSNHFPYVFVRPSTLGGSDTVFIFLSLQPEDEWANGYFENSKYGWFAIQDGELELIGEGLNAPKFCKTNIKDLVNKLIKWKEAYT